MTLLLQSRASKARQDVEAFLQHNLFSVDPGSAWTAGRQYDTTLCALLGRCGRTFRILRCTGLAPTPNLMDLAQALVQPDLLLSLNPFLSGASRGELLAGINLWLQLCVLEDRIERLGALLDMGDEFEPTLLRVSLRMLGGGTCSQLSLSLKRNPIHTSGAASLSHLGCM